MGSYKYGGCLFDSERACAVEEFYDYLLAQDRSNFQYYLAAVEDGSAIKDYLASVEAGDWIPSVPMMPGSVESVAADVADILRKRISEEFEG